MKTTAKSKILEIKRQFKTQNAAIVPPSYFGLYRIKMISSKNKNKETNLDLKVLQ